MGVGDGRPPSPHPPNPDGHRSVVHLRVISTWKHTASIRGINEIVREKEHSAPVQSKCSLNSRVFLKTATDRDTGVGNEFKAEVDIPYNKHGFVGPQPQGF